MLLAKLTALTRERVLGIQHEWVSCLLSFGQASFRQTNNTCESRLRRGKAVTRVSAKIGALSHSSLTDWGSVRTAREADEGKRKGCGERFRIPLKLENAPLAINQEFSSQCLDAFERLYFPLFAAIVDFVCVVNFVSAPIILLLTRL